MSDVKRFFSEKSGRQCVYAEDFDAAQSELAALREELATERSGFAASLERCRVYQDEQQARLTAAEQRNTVQRGLLHRALNVIRGMRYDELEAAIVKELNIPTESGASE